MGLEPAWWLVREAEGEQCPGEVGVDGWCGLLQSLGSWDAPTGLTPGEEWRPRCEATEEGGCGLCAQ